MVLLACFLVRHLPSQCVLLPSVHQAKVLHLHFDLSRDPHAASSLIQRNAPFQGQIENKWVALCNSFRQGQNIYRLILPVVDTQGRVGHSDLQN